MIGNLLSALGTGGPIIMILAILSIISITLICAKWLQFNGVNAGDKQRIEAFKY